MDLIENIIGGWLNSKGYFLIQNLKIGLNEIDALAIKLDKNHKVQEAIHIEVQCSSNPIGYIGGSTSAKKRSPKDIEKGVLSYIAKKFDSKKIKALVESLAGKDCKRWFICGVLKDETTIDYFKKKGVEVYRVWDIFKEVRANRGELKTGHGNRCHQLLHLSQL